MTVKFGLALMNDFPPDGSPASRLSMLREQARTACDCGFSSIWVLQHYLGSMLTLQPVPLQSALAADSGDPAGAGAALKSLEEQGLTYIILQAQWFDLPQEQVLATLESCRDNVLPAFAD